MKFSALAYPKASAKQSAGVARGSRANGVRETRDILADRPGDRANGIYETVWKVDANRRFVDCLCDGIAGFHRLVRFFTSKEEYFSCCLRMFCCPDDPGYKIVRMD